MVNIIKRPILSGQDLADIQQPLDKDGWTNDKFNSLYGEESNPSIGTERDRKNRKNLKTLSSKEQSAYERGWDYAFGKNEKPIKGKISKDGRDKLER